MKKILLLGVLVWCSTLNALAQDFIPFKTDQGCEIWHLEQPAVTGFSTTYAWDGACVGGFAQGPGTLTVSMFESSSKKKLSEQKISSKRHVGRAFGHAVFETNFSIGNSAPMKTSSLVFFGETTMATYPHGAFEPLPNNAWRNNNTPVASINPNWRIDGQRFNFGLSGIGLAYYKNSCMLRQDLYNDCSYVNGDGKTNYQVDYLMESDTRVKPIKNTHHACPPATSAAVCQAFFMERVEPMRQSIERFIKTNADWANAMADRMVKAMP